VRVFRGGEGREGPRREATGVRVREVRVVLREEEKSGDEELGWSCEVT
jgi:hypothetical protein